jgi:hypothetical protein
MWLSAKAVSILTAQSWHEGLVISRATIFFHRLYSPLGPWPLLFSFMIILQTVGLLGRVISSSQGHYLNIGQHKDRINIYTHQTSMPCVRFEPTIPASERAKTVHALDRSATVTGSRATIPYIYVYIYTYVKKYSRVEQDSKTTAPRAVGFGVTSFPSLLIYLYTSSTTSALRRSHAQTPAAQTFGRTIWFREIMDNCWCFRRSYDRMSRFFVSKFGTQFKKNGRMGQRNGGK